MVTSRARDDLRKAERKLIQIEGLMKDVEMVGNSFGDGDVMECTEVVLQKIDLLKEEIALLSMAIDAGIQEYREANSQIHPTTVLLIQDMIDAELDPLGISNGGMIGDGRI